MVRALWGLGTYCFLIASLAIAAEPGSDAAKSAKVDFQRDVAPLLARNCIDCHGPSLQMAELRLDQRRFVLGDDADPDLVKAGKSDESLLIKRLVDRKLGILMPPSFPFPPGEKIGLPDAAIDLLKAWIDQGAQWPEGITLASEPTTSATSTKTKALFAAIRAGDHRSVTELVSGEKDLVNATDRRGDTPLMYAGVYSDAAMVKVLLDQGADVNAINPEGATPLMRAAGEFEKAELLLSRGAKVDAKSKMGRTPLLIAATFPGNTKTVQLLLARGASVSDQDQMGETCLTSASKRDDAEMVKALIEAGANVTAGASWPGQAPLIWAAEEGNVATLACLLEHGAGKVQPHVDFALSSAAARGSLAAVRLLIEHGANPNTPSPTAGYTPLMWAAYGEDVDVEKVKLLLANGADPKAKGANGETALSLAMKHGHSAVVDLLDPSGAANSISPPKSIAAPVDPAQLKAAAEKSLPLLQECGPKFFERSGCVACHQQSVTSLAVSEARKRGLKVDEKTARAQVHVTVQFIKNYREKFLERADQPLSSPPSVGYIALGLSAEHYPPDENLDALIVDMAGRQHTDGSWAAFSHRPPLEYSRLASTALAIRSMQLYGPPGLKSQFDERSQRARQWLLAAEAATNQDQAFRLLGLSWAGVDQKLVEVQRDALLKSQ